MTGLMLFGGFAMIATTLFLVFIGRIRNDKPTADEKTVKPTDKPQAISKSGAASENIDQASKTEMLAFSPILSEESRIPFENMIKGFLDIDHTQWSYWRDKVLMLKKSDAYEYIATVLDFAFADGIIMHYKRMREVMDDERVPMELYMSYCRALATVESFLKHESFPAVHRIRVNPLNALELSPDHQDRIETIASYINDGIEDEDDLEELEEIAREKAPESALRSAFIRVTTVDAQEQDMLDGIFKGLAIKLSILSKWDEDNNEVTDLSGKCHNLATSFASLISPQDVEYADIADSLGFAEIKLPEYKPRISVHEINVLPAGGVNVRKKPDADNTNTSAASDTVITEASMFKTLSKSLAGMVGLEPFCRQFATDVFEFINSGQSRGRVFWGSSGVGKTEFAQRLAGLREGYPGLELGEGNVTYVSGVDGRLEVRAIVDELDAGSILFVDEADKCLDPAASMVNAAEATQLHHAIVTHFSRKPIYWVLLGTFSAMRGDRDMTYEMLQKTVGNELTARLDFLDWKFPNWTLESLLRAVKGLCRSRGLSYEDEALLSIAQHCLEMGGGVRVFDNIDQALARRFRKERSSCGPVTSGHVEELLRSMGFKQAA